MSELARRAVATKSGISPLVDRMAADGLLEREACPSDRRVVRVGLSAAGRELHRGAQDVWDAALQRHLAAHLTRRELKLLVRVLLPLRERRSADWSPRRSGGL